jgi:hypothetical protein
MHSYELSRANRNEVAFRRDNENAFVAVNRGNPETAINYFANLDVRCHDFNSEQGIRFVCGNRVDIENGKFVEWR